MTGSTYRALVYAAVSTEIQADDEHNSIPMQLAACRQACERAGWPVEAEIVVPGHSRDYAYLSELTADCPEIAQVVQLIEAERVNLVVVRHYDRLWRTDWLRSDWTRLMSMHRCQVYSVEQPRATGGGGRANTVIRACLSRAGRGCPPRQPLRAWWSAHAVAGLPRHSGVPCPARAVEPSCPMVPATAVTTSASRGTGPGVA